MKLFNAFQLVCLFACGPFIIQYLHTASFVCATAAFWVAIVAYLLGFGALCISVADDL